jgi:uncharacterized protein DUF3106
MRYRLLTSLLACWVAGSALAQSPAPATPANPAAAPRAHAAQPSVAQPTWHDLNAEQREALQPLAGDWDKFDAVRKKKWLVIAAKYPNMSAEGKKRLHERMPQLARLTPEQHETTRENFRRAYSLPADQRVALTQKYQELPEDRKRALAAQAPAKRPATTARRTAPAAHPTNPPAAPLHETSPVR